MKDLKEAEKNFLTCAILTIIVGIALLFLGKNTVGGLSIAAGVVFIGVFVKMVITRKNGEDGDEN